MFYTYDQNNSGGSFVVDDRVTYTVIVEADSAEEADRIAEDRGIYFDGCDDGRDCPCCGDRWYRQHDGDGDKAPEIYGKHPKDHKETWAKAGTAYCYLYKNNGERESFIKAEK